MKLHPDSRSAAVTRIEVDAARPRPGHLVLCYSVTGKMSDVRMPPATASARADGLWRRTCFEAFVQASPSAGYHEFNFAPSTHWAAYRFSGYRTGMQVVDEMTGPRFKVDTSGAGFRMRVSLELDPLPDLPGDSAWRLGLSAVIEETGGRQSYWALAHPPGTPDFHHSDCFARELAAPLRP